MINKIQKIFLFLGLFTNQILLPISVVAQEITPVEPTPTEVISPTPTEVLTDTITPTPDLTPTPTDTPTPEITPEVTPTPEEVLSVAPVVDQGSQVVVVIEIGNSATVDQVATAQSNTGGNTTESNNSTTSTGDAISVGNMVNMVNSTSIDSSVKVYLLNSISGEMTELDLNSLWKLLETEQQATGDVNNSFVNITNFAQVTNQLDVSANTGGNLIDGKNSTINTGNAYALANIINLINTNFIGSRVFVGVLNIDASNLGDIILPNPESFANGSSNYGLGSALISNSADVSTISLASSDTGNNSIDGKNSDINTGNAISASNVSTMANLNLLNSSQMMLTINTLGSWTGSILNWASPGAIEAGVGGMFVSNGQAIALGNLDLSIFNIAQILNMASATASTGNNSIIGKNSAIQTGNAYALANVANLANLNIIGSNWFYGMINIIGDWKGNAIFAYPDMAIDINASKSGVNEGEQYQLGVSYKNEGYDEARKVFVSLDLPEGLEYVGDSSGKPVMRNGSNLKWEIGNVSAKASGGFGIEVRAKYEGQAGLLVKKVMAEEGSIFVASSVSTINTEITLENNSDSVNTKINQNNHNDGANANGNDDNLNPKLVISAKNNVNDFVYDGDVVTFQVDAKNEGEARAKSTYILHKIYDENNNLQSQNRINVGDVNIGGSGKVTFGIKMKTVNKQQTFTSETVWMGSKENGDEVISNVATTNFLIKSRLVKTNFSAPQVQAVSIDGAILGDSNVCLPVVDLIPFVLLFIISALWILRQIKRWQVK